MPVVIISTSMLNVCPELIDGILCLLLGYNIVKNDKAISMIKLCNFLRLEVIDIEGDCETLLIVGYFGELEIYFVLLH